MTTWSDIRMPAEDERLWELYHENSKTPRYQSKLNETSDLLDKLHVSLPTQPLWRRKLIDDVSFSRENVVDMSRDGEEGKQVTLDQLCRILDLAISSSPGEPSPVALWPLEIYGVVLRMNGMSDGIIHVDRERQEIACIRDVIDQQLLTECVQSNDGVRTSLYITALFERSALIYGEKGYRFALTESGRLVQNILLSAETVGVNAKMETQYYERSIEELLGIDGVGHAVLQVISFG